MKFSFSVRLLVHDRDSTVGVIHANFTQLHSAQLVAPLLHSVVRHVFWNVLSKTCHALFYKKTCNLGTDRSGAKHSQYDRCPRNHISHEISSEKYQRTADNFMNLLARNFCSGIKITHPSQAIELSSVSIVTQVTIHIKHGRTLKRDTFTLGLSTREES